MTKRMLIDSTHPEETRVAIVNGNRLEEYDYESVARKQLKSNIYLVKVTRVEPSLQAAFVDFGGNRHGFLPFPEIHPDYYRIPIADREALLAEERAYAAAQAAKQDAEDEAELAASGESLDLDDTGEDGSEDSEHTAEIEEIEDSYVPAETGSLASEIAQPRLEDGEDDSAEDSSEENEAENQPYHTTTTSNGITVEAVDVMAAIEAGADPAAVLGVQDPDAPQPEVSFDGAVADENYEEGGDERSHRPSMRRRYKIQEVIKRNQIMLIQISKEERGNKGAAVTSYISLPGRYCVLMPNSPRGGGVSRKVSNAKDRQRLKAILRELNVPEGMSVILRTAGVSRSTAEIKRDLDYLLRLWDQIREFTLKSTAPQLIYEEGNLIKRAIRDLYKRDIDEVHVAGEEAFNSARDFMKMLMPSHVDRVHHYNDPSIPLFFRYQVESQIDAIHSPTVHLKSGGYIVINPTEALVSIDVNSGRATKGRHIEETALKTNIEAAEEIARQLRLRDQGGLIVIDFIDMEDRRGNRIVEKKLRDAMASDRARIQLGRISPFGLLELSRQRLHPSLVETNFETCKHCNGQGIVRTIETAGVMVLRAIEEEGLKGRSTEIKVSVPADVALYIFNHKRDMLASVEKRYNLRVYLSADDTLINPAYTIEALRGENRGNRPARPQPVLAVDMRDMPDLPADEITDDSTFAEENDSEGGIETLEGDNDQGNRGGRDRHRGGGGRDRGRDRGGRGRDRHRGRDRDRPRGDRPQHQQAEGAPAVAAADAAPFDDGQPPAPRAEGDDQGERRRRRGRRGGRRRGGRERGDRPHGQTEGGQSAEGGHNNGPANDRPTSFDAGNGGGGNDYSYEPSHNSDGGAESAEGGSRKGWWKRLTE